MNLKEFLVAARRYRLTFVLVTVAVFAVGLGWIFLTAAKFVSTVQLHVSIDGSTTASAYQNDEVVAGRINTYVPLLTSGVVTQRVIDELGLPLTATELADKINATRVPPRTAIIDVTVTDDSPQQAQLIANTLANEFVSYTGELEAPTGEDAQKVHTTVVSSAGEARGNYAERVLLGLPVAVGALLLGAVAVWGRARYGLTARTAADRTAAEPITDAPEQLVLANALDATTELPVRRAPNRRVQERLDSIPARFGPPKAWESRPPLPDRELETASIAPATEVLPDKTEPYDRHRTTRDILVKTEPRIRTPWLLGFFCFLNTALPSTVVTPGPLKSNGSPARMIAVIFLGLVILGFFLIRRIAPTRTIQPGVLLIVLYLLLQFVVYGVGLTRVTTEFIQAGSTRMMIMLFAQAGLALYVITRLQTTRQRTFTLGCLAVGLIYACVIGLLQSRGIDLRNLLRPPGFVLNSDWGSITAIRHGVGRVTGTSEHAIEFSVLAAVAVPIMIHFARYAAKREIRWLAALACLTALVAIPAAVSRTGVIALFAALLVYVWSFKVLHIAFATAGGIVLGFIYTAFVPGTALALWRTITESEEDVSVTERIADYAVVGESFRSNPLFGMGFGTSDPEIFGYLDNDWLQTLVQGGLLGITAMVLFVVGGLVGISAALRAASTARERDQAYAIGAVFVGLLSSTFTFDLTAFQQAALLYFLAFGMLWSTFKIPVTNVESEPQLETTACTGRSARPTAPFVGVR